ncbi:MAG TPA: hypothetical protein VGJ74_02505 [Burkholderiales bacterium]|jgi:hypothetical protein
MLWKKLWLLFTVIWVVVSALNAGSILAFSEEHEKALRPIVLGISVPALLYLVLFAWQRLRKKPQGSDPNN